MTEVVFANPILVGLIIGLPATVLGVMAYRRTVKADRAATVTAATSAASTTTKNIINGLNILLDQVQKDNDTLRENQQVLQNKLLQVETDCTAIRTELTRVTKLLTDRGVADDLLATQKDEADVLRGEQKDEAKRVEDEGS